LSGTYNAAFHFFPLDFPYERYEKQILVPIGEYIPFRQWDRFAQFIGNQFGIYSSFDPGVESKVFKTPVPSGISICLEETFAHLIRQSRLKGAELFVNLTNDAWFPDSKLPYQHFDHGRVRAVENGVPILRACNSGISGAIDCFGRIVKTLPVEKKGVSILSVSLPIRSYTTLYTIWGDGAILGISLSAMLSYFLFRKKKLP
jgi:apolipoprotein N-acyltransferase